MRFKCLVMDHDDTTVNSTATIHFPSFLAYLKLVRPEASYTLEEYFRKNFDPGIMALFTGELGFSEEEIEGEFRFWQDWVRTRIPVAYPGIREILQRHKEAGGRIAVVSHSMRENIERDYRENDLPEPDVILGGGAPPRPPSPHTRPGGGGGGPPPPPRELLFVVVRPPPADEKKPPAPPPPPRGGERYL